MTVWIKQGVLGDMRRPIRRAVGILTRLLASRNEDFFIYSLREGNHMPGSLHYDGLAIDFGRGGLTLAEIHGALGRGYDVVFYDVDPYRPNPDGIYCHLEWDPKED